METSWNMGDDDDVVIVQKKRSLTIDGHVYIYNSNYFFYKSVYYDVIVEVFFSYDFRVYDVGVFRVEPEINKKSKKLPPRTNNAQ